MSVDDIWPEQAKVTVVTTDTIVDKWIDSYCRELVGSEAVKRLKLELKGLKALQPKSGGAET